MFHVCHAQGRHMRLNTEPAERAHYLTVPENHVHIVNSL